MKPIIFVYNPFSGDNHISTQLDPITALYQEAGFSMVLFRITREKGLRGLAGLVRSTDPAHLLVAGGDGTLNRLVNYLMEREVKVPLAILPTGTANDFAHMIGMKNASIKSCRSILSGEVREIDLGRVNGQYFLNVLSSGLFTDISQKTPAVLKNTLGKLAYYFSSLGELPSFRKINITVDSQDHSFEGKCLLFLVFNGRSAGNISLANRSQVDDGKLDVMIIKGDNIVESIKTAFHILMKRSSEYPKDTVYFQTSRLTINSGEYTTDVDGERGPRFPLEIECLPGALPVIVPEKEK